MKRKSDTRRSLEQMAQSSGITPEELAELVHEEHLKSRREWYREHSAAVDDHRDASAIHRLTKRGYTVTPPGEVIPDAAKRYQLALCTEYLERNGWQVIPRLPAPPWSADQTRQYIGLVTTETERLHKRLHDAAKAGDADE